MAELTSAGYDLKTQNEYFEEERDLYLAIDSEWNLDPSTPDGLKIAHDAEIFGNLDETLKAAYDSKDPNKARDTDLNIICALTGVERSPGTPSTVTLTLTGTAGTVIAAGKTVASVVDGTEWTTDTTVTLNGVGTASVNATCTTIGAINASPETITRIVDTVGGWQAVSNPGVATPGTEQETNAELRIRRANSVGKPGVNQIDSMYGEIANTDGVRRVAIYENDTNVTDSNGLPAHSIAPIVDGGSDEDVALAIYLKKNPGVALHVAATEVSVLVTSPTYVWQTKTIKFSRPEYVDMTVAVELTDNGSLPANIEDIVIDAILNYTQGDLLASDVGFNPLGFAIGESVAVSRLYTPINNVVGPYGGPYVSGLTINGSGSGTIAIAFNELSRWTEANITVTVV